MKLKYYLFAAVCMLFCLMFSVCTLFFPTTESTENKVMAEAPVLFDEDGSLNTSVFEEFEDYFEEHMAFRNPLIYADAQIMSNVFGVSNVGGVICGTDGWLYYSSSLDDYLGTEQLSERDLFNIAHNLGIVQTYLDNRGITSAMMIAPNKNTLYGENMPYYDSMVVNTAHTAEIIAPQLESQGVTYINLFDLFSSQEEVLYLKRDSHWGNKGALLVCNAVMSELGRSLSCTETSSETPTTANGDLNKMLYSFYGSEELDCAYDTTGNYEIIQGTSVESGAVLTSSTSGEGTLLMFRDSFANTMIPFLSPEFETAFYSKGQPHALEMYIDLYQPDYVVIEKVERNFTEYLSEPPRISAVQADEPTEYTIYRSDSSVSFTLCEDSPAYCMISGTVDDSFCSTETEILVEVDGTLYRTYQTGGNSYLIYLKRDLFEQDTAFFRLFTVTGNVYSMLDAETIAVPAAEK